MGNLLLPKMIVFYSKKGGARDPIFASSLLPNRMESSRPGESSPLIISPNATSAVQSRSGPVIGEPSLIDSIPVRRVTGETPRRTKGRVVVALPCARATQPRKSRAESSVRARGRSQTNLYHTFVGAVFTIASEESKGLRVVLFFLRARPLRLHNF